MSRYQFVDTSRNTRQELLFVGIGTNWIKRLILKLAQRFAPEWRIVTLGEPIELILRQEAEAVWESLFHNRPPSRVEDIYVLHIPVDDGMGEEK